MREIPLTKGQIAIVDDEDYDALAKHSWYYCQQENTGYAMRDVWTDGKRTTIYMHRFIAFGDNADNKLDVDHKDRIGTHNWRANLRPCTRAFNLHNCRLYKNNKSGAKGVVLDKRTGKWRAEIRIRGKSHYLGVFDTIEEASAKYREAALATYGE